MQPTPLHRELPERADEDVVARQIHVLLGGDAHILRVLTIQENRDWTALVADKIRERIAESGVPDSLDAVVLILSQSIDTMLDLILAYDLDSVLPDRVWIDSHATDREVYEGMKRVTAAAYPFGFDLRAIAPELIPMVSAALTQGIAAAALTLASSEFTSARRRLTAGLQGKSTPGSPTNFSTATSKPSLPAKSRKRKSKPTV